MMLLPTRQRTVHLVPVRADVQHDVGVEEPAVLGVQGGEDGQHHGVGDTVADHVQHCPEFCRLVEGAGGHPVE